MFEYLMNRKRELTLEVSSFSDKIMEGSITEGEERQLKSDRDKAEARLDEVEKALSKQKSLIHG